MYPHLFESMKNNRWWPAFALLVLCSTQAPAAIQEITAEFRPDSSKPLQNKFTNTTPESGICPGHIPSVCKALNIFSIRSTELTFASAGPIQAYHTDVRKGAMFKLSSHWRDLIVTNTQTGHTERVQIRIAGIGGRYNLGGGVSHNVFPTMIWQYPTSAGLPCQSTGYATGTSSFLLWSWLVPLNTGICAVQAIKDIPRMTYSMTEYSYELRTPNPLTMRGGIYTGQTVFSVGPGKDFDFGDIMLPADDSLTFNFTLNVEHVLKVEVPPGGNRVVLEPQEGWQNWLQRGRKPSRLYQDQTLHLWASPPFRMTLECAEPLDNACSVRNAAGHQVPLDMAVSLPSGLSFPGGRPVSRQPLRLDGQGTERFEPTHYVDRKPSTLHFEIRPDAVAQMLEHAGSTYSGTVTVVWDSDI